MTTDGPSLPQRDELREEIARIVEADGWGDVDVDSLAQQAVEAVAWGLLDATSDLADREPSPESVEEARATARRILAARRDDLAEKVADAPRAKAYPKATCDGPSALDMANARADRWKERYETTAEKVARVEALAEEATERAFAQIAADKMLTIQPLPGGRAKVPPHWRDEAEARAMVPVTDLRAALTSDPGATEGGGGRG